MANQLLLLPARLLQEVVKDDCPGAAAEMAFHMIMFSAPGLILVLAVFGLFGRKQDIAAQLLYYAAQILPADALKIFSGLMDTVAHGSSGGLAVFGLMAALWAAINAAGTMTKALRRAYGVNDREISKKLSFFQKINLSFMVIFSFGLTLLIGSNILIFGNVIFDYITLWTGKPVIMVVHLIHWLIISSFMIMISAYIYRIVPGYPYTKVAWRKAIIGATFFVGLWLFLSLLFGLYVQHFSAYNHIYGTLGAFIILMLWLYLASLAFLAGGELNSLSDRQSDRVL